MGGRGGRGGAAGTVNTESSGVVTTNSKVVAALGDIHHTRSDYDFFLGEGQHMMSDLRDALARQGITDRADQDAAIRAADRARVIYTQPAVAKIHLTPREHGGAINIGDEQIEIVSLWKTGFHGG